MTWDGVQLMRVTNAAEAVAAVVVVAQPCGSVRTYFLSPTLRVLSRAGSLRGGVCN